MSFSQRIGLKPLEKEIQRESMDEELCNGLWSCFHNCYIDNWNGRFNELKGTNLELLFIRFWHSFFKYPIDNLNLGAFEHSANRLREFFFNATWNEVYDFTEFALKNGPEEFAQAYRELVNDVLERDNSAYRFVADEIAEITSEFEIEAIKTAIEDSSADAGARTHLCQALQQLSDRKNPDYRNSIKESISAVESLCQRIAGEPKTLGQSLKSLEPELSLHPALRDAFIKLYGYTSNADGIRHAMMDDGALSYSE